MEALPFCAEVIEREEFKVDSRKLQLAVLPETKEQLDLPARVSICRARQRTRIIMPNGHSKMRH